MTNEEIITQIRENNNVPEYMALLWQQNKKAAFSLVNRYKGYCEVEDLLQESYLGLCEAVNQYREEENIKFITYALYWMKQKVYRYIENNGCLVRLPAGERSMIIKYKRVAAEFEQQFGREPSNKELQTLLDLSPEQLEHIKRSFVLSNTQSLESPAASSDDNLLLMDMISDQSDIEHDIVEEITVKERNKILWGLVDELPEEQHEIIMDRYKDNLTLKATGEKRGIPVHQVQQQEYKAIRTLRSDKNRKALAPYADDYIYSYGLRHVSTRTFFNTWTSSTEYTVLNMNKE